MCIVFPFSLLFLSALSHTYIHTHLRSLLLFLLEIPAPLGSVPTLKVGDFQHCQSIAMARYAAKLAGLYPDDPVQALFCDEVMDTLNELMSKAPKSKDSDELKKLREEFQATVMTTTGAFVESIIQTNGKGKSICDVPSVADLAVMGTVDSIASGNWDHIDPNFFDAYPGIKECYKTMKDHPGVKAYYESKAEKKN